MLKIQILDDRLDASMLKPATKGSAAIDLRACISNTLVLGAGKQLPIPTGLSVAIDKLHVGKLYPRSGKGLKGLVLGNLTGVIDSDYRGEIIVVLWNRNLSRSITVEPMDAIAQFVVQTHYDYSKMKIIGADEQLDKTTRGKGGFGSTDKVVEPPGDE